MFLNKQNYIYITFYHKTNNTFLLKYNIMANDRKLSTYIPDDLFGYQKGKQDTYCCHLSLVVFGVLTSVKSFLNLVSTNNILTTIIVSFSRRKMPYCAAYGCGNRASRQLKQEKGISFHS